MAYIDSSYYNDTFHGFKVPSTNFDYYSERATEQLNEAINVDELVDDEITTEVKNCTCAVMDLMYGFENTKVVASETVGPHKKSYKDTSTTVTNERQIYNAIVKYLSKTGLLYRGAVYEY